MGLINLTRITKATAKRLLPKISESEPNTGVLRYALSLPPSINHYYLTARNGKRILTDKAKEWMRDAQAHISLARHRAGWHTSNGRQLIMRIWAYWPDARRRDMSNLHKALCDAPEGIVYVDDRMVIVQDIGFEIDRKNPRVEVGIEEVICMREDKVEFRKDGENDE